MKALNQVAACAALALVLAGCGGSGTRPPNPDAHALSLSVLSSRPDQVSGGDARIAVAAPPAWLDGLTFWLNGKQITPAMKRVGHHVEGVATGLVNGKNVLEVRYRNAQGSGMSDAITLVNHPITGPIFTGPQQRPFICRTQESGLGQPLVDNQQGIGHPVFDGKQVIGHSQYCSIPTRFQYLYFNGSDFKPFDPATGFTSPPADLKTIRVKEADLPFVVRIEGGTIDRFIYTVAMLAPFAEAAAPGQMNNSAWNERLVYWMRGGIGIGHQQGIAMWFNGGLSRGERALMPQLLGRGYAVVTSSSNDTSTHYNMRLAEETAMMTKEHFVERYGKPRFTIGLGASGGGVQQYMFAQNRPGLLDGGIPIQAYPDMVTQTTPISDCPLLGRYFMEETALDPQSRWATWGSHQLIEGMNASDTVPNPITGKPGSTECINGWRTAMPTVLNPQYKDPQYDARAESYGYPPDLFAKVKWTHWNDLENVYGTDDQGFAPVSVDNVGVQYGLASFIGGQISADEFLRVNACVGGWKAQRDFVTWDVQADPFDARNMKSSATCRDPAGVPAARYAGQLAAMQKAYTSGHVFTGRHLDIPMIDLRPYLEPALNMHNARQAFSVRARLRDANPRLVKHQVIWFTGSEADLQARALDALAVMDRYLTDGRAPVEFTDKCTNASGALIAAGPMAWDGILGGKVPGACAAAYPIYSSPRMLAGESIKGDTFKCALKPVSTALQDGTYQTPGKFSAAQKAWLARIFPDGVCDYSRGDQGRPPAQCGAACH